MNLKKKIKKFVYIAVLLIIISIIAGFFINIKTVMVISFSLLLVVGYIIYKERIGQQLIIAFLIAIAWTSYYFYEYTTSNLFVGQINLFPLLSWTFGLVLLREIYERMKGKYKFVQVTILYLAVLFIVEYIGYNFGGIQLSSNFPALPILGIIHGPLLMKIFYIIAGPIYLLITDYLKVK